MKLQYVKPSAETVFFENEDVITTSGCNWLGVCGEWAAQCESWAQIANEGGGCTNPGGGPGEF